MIGALIGDTIGSVYEFNNYKGKDFPLFNSETTFTDDSVLTLALAKSLLENNGKINKNNLINNFQNFCQKDPNRGYGYRFNNWIYSQNPKPYNSLGNGSAMRVSPVAYCANSLEEVKDLAKQSAEITHNHPEGIRGAQATATAVYMALNKYSKDEIKKVIQDEFYPLDFGGTFSINKIRPDYKFDVTCDGSVPQALEAFFEGKDFEDVIRTAISLGGDSDTIAAIAGSIAGAYYQIPEELEKQVLSYFDKDSVEIINNFREKFINE